MLNTVPTGPAIEKSAATPWQEIWSSTYARFMRLRNIPIGLLAGLIGAVLALVIAETLTEQYVAHARLLVDPRDLRVLEREVTPGSPQLDNASTMIVESQVQVIKSAGVLKQVVRDLSLDKDPEFNGELQGPFEALIGPLKNALKSLVGSSDKPVEPSRIALETLHEQMDAGRIHNSLIVEVTAISNDPEKSQRIADALLAAYLKDQAASRTAAAETAGDSIDSRLEELKSKVSLAEKKVEAYKTQNDLMLASGRTLTEQETTELNNQLISVRAELERLRAKRDAVRAAGRNLDAIPEAVSSATLQALRAQHSIVSANKAKLGAQLKPRHPAMRAVADQERSLKRNIADELSRIKSVVESEFERARTTELALAAELKKLEASMNKAGAARIRLRELERDLEASKAVYQTALLRTREAREQANLNTANVRIVAPGLAEIDRVFPPPRPFSALLGFLIGLAVALVAIWIFELWLAARTHSKAHAAIE